MATSAGEQRDWAPGSCGRYCDVVCGLGWAGLVPLCYYNTVLPWGNEDFVVTTESCCLYLITWFLFGLFQEGKASSHL